MKRILKKSEPESNTNFIPNTKPKQKNYIRNYK